MNHDPEAAPPRLTINTRAISAANAALVASVRPLQQMNLNVTPIIAPGLRDAIGKLSTVQLASPATAEVTAGLVRFAKFYVAEVAPDLRATTATLARFAQVYEPLIPSIALNTAVFPNLHAQVSGLSALATGLRPLTITHAPGGRSPRLVGEVEAQRRFERFKAATAEGSAFADVMEAISSEPEVAQAFTHAAALPMSIGALGQREPGLARKRLQALRDILDGYRHVADEIDRTAPEVARAARLPVETVGGVEEFFAAGRAVRDWNPSSLALIAGGGVLLTLGMGFAATETLSLDTLLVTVGSAWGVYAFVNKHIKSNLPTDD